MNSTSNHQNQTTQNQNQNQAKTPPLTKKSVTHQQLSTHLSREPHQQNPHQEVHLLSRFDPYLQYKRRQQAAAARLQLGHNNKWLLRQLLSVTRQLPPLEVVLQPQEEVISQILPPLRQLKISNNESSMPSMLLSTDWEEEDQEAQEALGNLEALLEAEQEAPLLQHLPHNSRYPQPPTSESWERYPEHTMAKEKNPRTGLTNYEDITGPIEESQASSHQYAKWLSRSPSWTDRTLQNGQGPQASGSTPSTRKPMTFPSSGTPSKSNSWRSLLTASASKERGTTYPSSK